MGVMTLVHVALCVCLLAGGCKSQALFTGPIELDDLGWTLKESRVAAFDADDGMFGATGARFETYEKAGSDEKIGMSMMEFMDVRTARKLVLVDHPASKWNRGERPLQGIGDEAWFSYHYSHLGPQQPPVGIRFGARSGKVIMGVGGPADSTAVAKVFHRVATAAGFNVLISAEDVLTAVETAAPWGTPWPADSWTDQQEAERERLGNERR